jgi:hypothetical protein
MMTRARIIRRSTRVNLIFSPAHQHISSSRAATASRQRPGHHDQVPSNNNERHRVHRPRRTRISQRSTWNNLLFSAAHQQSCSSPAAEASRPRQRTGHHDQVPAKNNERRRGHRPRHHDQVPATHNERHREQRPGHHDKWTQPCDAQRAPPRATAWAPISSTSETKKRARETTGLRPTYKKAGHEFSLTPL